MTEVDEVRRVREDEGRIVLQRLQPTAEFRNGRFGQRRILPSPVRLQKDSEGIGPV